MRIRKLGFTLVMAIVLLLVLNISSVFAAPPLTLKIEAYEVIGIPAGHAFTVTGPAMDAGLICESGTIENLSIVVINSNGPFTTLKVDKRFTCGDGSGTFDVSMVVKLDNATNYTTANWQIKGGTDDYVDLKGQGSLVGTPGEPGTDIYDVYNGKAL